MLKPPSKRSYFQSYNHKWEDGSTHSAGNNMPCNRTHAMMPLQCAFCYFTGHAACDSLSGWQNVLRHREADRQAFDRVAERIHDLFIIQHKLAKWDEENASALAKIAKDLWDQLVVAANRYDYVERTARQTTKYRDSRFRAVLDRRERNNKLAGYFWKQSEKGRTGL